MRIFDSTIKETLSFRVQALEDHFSADVAFFYGEIRPDLVRSFRDFVEQLNESPKKSKRSKRLVFFVNTPGGSVEAVEKMVEILRFHYSDISFVVPDFAMSAGTILCMSGDRILMDYSSSLGPIDPQVFNGSVWVPALGYLDKVEQLLEKARANTLTNAEFLILQSQDLAQLSRYEQARDLTITLLKKWLVDYKFRNWKVHRSDPALRDKAVSIDEKRTRATEIAKLLGDNKQWHSHGRLIGPATLRDLLRLEIDDYSEDTVLRGKIRAYNDLITDYVARSGIEIFMHSKNYF